jgi:hypothetical protein
MRTVHKRYVKLKKIVSARLALASPGYQKIPLFSRRGGRAPTQSARAGGPVGS